jgi:hypothetical protein
LASAPEVPATLKSLAQKPVAEAKTAVKKQTLVGKAVAKPATLI